MALALKSYKNTAFRLEEKIELTTRYFPGLLPQLVTVESDHNYPTIGYTIETSNYLNNKALIIKVTDVKNPQSGLLPMPGRATGTAFQYANRSTNIDYDTIRKLLSGPKGTTIDIILKDEHTNRGTEDTYELTF